MRGEGSWLLREDDERMRLCNKALALLYEVEQGRRSSMRLPGGSQLGCNMSHNDSAGRLMPA